MDKTIVSIAFFPIIALLMIFMVEYSIHTVYFNKISSVSEFAVKTAENEGGLNSSVINKVEYRMAQEGLPRDRFKIEYSPIEKIGFNEAFQITIKGTHTYNALNMLGTGIGNVETQLIATNVGYSNVWHR